MEPRSSAFAEALAALRFYLALFRAHWRSAPAQAAAAHIAALRVTIKGPSAVPAAMNVHRPNHGARTLGSR